MAKSLHSLHPEVVESEATTPVAHQVHEKIMDLRVLMLMEDVVTLGSIILGVYL